MEIKGIVQYFEKCACLGSYSKLDKNIDTALISVGQT